MAGEKTGSDPETLKDGRGGLASVRAAGRQPVRASWGRDTFKHEVRQPQQQRHNDRNAAREDRDGDPGRRLRLAAVPSPGQEFASCSRGRNFMSRPTL
jgi:hypothetical protein